jgi:hypothetical protein
MKPAMSYSVATAEILRSQYESNEFDPKDKYPGACTEFHRVHSEFTVQALIGASLLSLAHPRPAGNAVCFLRQTPWALGEPANY